jgi:hypothetical protein
VPRRPPQVTVRRAAAADVHTIRAMTTRMTVSGNSLGDILPLLLEARHISNRGGDSKPPRTDRLTFPLAGCYYSQGGEVSPMNEVDELSKIDHSALPPLKTMLLDDLYQNVLKNLHLELGSGPVLYLISPNYSVLNPTPDETITDFISRNESLLDYIKESVVQNLAVYSVLIDVSSYFIEQNNGLVLARFRERDSEGRRYEIKFYTHSPQELTTHYEDKIYIGRDFVDLFNSGRKYFGVKDSIISLKTQYEKLLARADAKLKKPAEFKSYFQEIGESVNELHNESLLVLQSLPPHLDFAKLSGKDLIDVNAQYRAINHFVIELHDEVGEFENLLRAKKHSDFVRYVTKYKKDVTNMISYFNIKVNGLITQRIYQMKSRHV